MTDTSTATAGARPATGTTLRPVPLRTAAALLTSLVVALLLSLPTLVPPAAAHAALVSVSPADGSTVTRASTRVVLRFSEALSRPSVVVVTGPDGARVDVGGTTVAAASATVQVRLTDAGRHTVSYRVVSDDGHPVTGRTTFGYRPRPAAPEAGESVTGGASEAPTASANEAPTNSPSEASAGDAGTSEQPGGTSRATATGLTAGGVLVVSGAALLLVRGRRGEHR